MLKKHHTNYGAIKKFRNVVTLRNLQKKLKQMKRKRHLIDHEYQPFRMTAAAAAAVTTGKRPCFSSQRVRFLRKATREDFLYNGTFLEAVGPVLVMAQFFCLMPVRGIRTKTARCLSFSWRSFRTWYCLFYMCTTLADTGLTFNMVIKNKPDVRNIEPLVFHFSILLASIGFLRLATKWPQLMRDWAKVEKKLPPHTTWRLREELPQKIKRVTFVLIMLSLTEHLLSTISAIHFANYCPARKDPIEAYFIVAVPQLFYVFEYSTWLAWLGRIQNILMTFGWSYMDIFVMIMGIGLSSLYKQIQCNIERVQGQCMPECFWVTTRYQYRIVCELVEEVDGAISAITMLSFANNLYFVCIQLLRSINKMPSVAHGVYFYFSLMFLLARTLAVSLFLSEVNDRARDPLLPLQFVPKDGYYTEVERFASEVATDSVTLTGLKYFSVTRKLVLAVAGTIITYELVLIQFHEDQNLWNCGED